MRCLRFAVPALLISMLAVFTAIETDAVNSDQNTTSSAPAIPVYRVPADYAYFTAEKKEMPSYPADALDKGLAGEVILDAEFSTDGRVTDVQRILGDPILAKAGIEAVLKWKFLPVVYKRQKSRGLSYVGFRFLLSERSVRSLFPLGKWYDTPPDISVLHHDEPQRVRISSGIAAGRKIAGSNPRYPDSAKYDHVEGEVDLRGIIDKQGNVALLEIVKTPSQDLAIAAIEAVRTWRYQPFLLEGKPVDVETVIVVKYELRG